MALDAALGLQAAAALGERGVALVGEAGLAAATAERLAGARVVVLAWDGDPEPVEALEARLPAGAELVGLLPPVGLNRLIQLVAGSPMNHVFTADPADPPAAAPWLRATIAKVRGGEPFGLDRYLAAAAPQGAAVIDDYAGRSRVLAELLAFAERADLRAQVRSHIAGACDELMMNALYDAPVDEAGRPVFADLDVKRRIARRSPRKVSVRYGGDRAGFAVAVRDGFGRLDKETVVRHIERCLRRPAPIDDTRQGAGLGLFLVLCAASHVVVSVDPGRGTEVICQFDRDGVRGGLRGLSIFVAGGAAGARARSVG